MLKIVCFAGVLYFIINLFLVSDLFKVKTITVEGANEFVNKADVAQFGKNNAQAKNIFLLTTSDLTSKLEKTFLGAKSIRVKKVYPDTIKIDIFERAPIAIVKNTDSPDHYLLDPQGYILGYTDPAARDLPNILYEQEIRVGEFIDSNLVPLYNEVTTVLKHNEVKVSSISFSLRDFSFYVVDGPQVLVAKDKNVSEAIKAVGTLIKQVGLEGKIIKLIDLRYDKVIVSFN